MIIRDQENFIAFTLAEVDSPPAGHGDGHFHVKVSAHGFTGENFVWIEAFEFHSFVDQLQGLWETKEGAIALESMSPHELRLVIRILEKTGGVAVEGELRRNVVIQSRRRRVENRLVFALDLDASSLPETLRQFKKLQAQFPLP